VVCVCVDVLLGLRFGFSQEGKSEFVALDVLILSQAFQTSLIDESQGLFVGVFSLFQ
jgi:hypothetical protein